MGSPLPIVDRTHDYQDRFAISDDDDVYTYGELLSSSERGAARLPAGELDLVRRRQ